MLGHLNSFGNTPTPTPTSGAPPAAPHPLQAAQGGPMVHPPLKDLKRLQASATYLTPSSCQDSVGCQGPRAGWGIITAPPPTY